MNVCVFVGALVIYVHAEQFVVGGMTISPENSPTEKQTLANFPRRSFDVITPTSFDLPTHVQWIVADRPCHQWRGVSH
jgi:hypothetical protein